ncbi:nucleotidyltransferase domain-containing protein [archaeon]|nr:nucleotidyltransferase domain-containing protein [archaeon]
MYDLYSIKNLADLLSETYFPKAIILFGSYSKGEDIETSDIDIVVVTKTKKNLDVEKFEKLLKRKIHLIVIDSTEKLDKNIEHKLMNGIIIYGDISWTKYSK